MSDKFSSRTSFIMASVGSAVGLGNIFRFPALAVKYGGIYIIVYILLLFLLGIPIMMSEIALGRKFNQLTTKTIAPLKRKMSPFNWLCCANSFVIMTYYCVLFSFVILAAVFSYKLYDKTPDKAANIFPEILSSAGGFPFDTLLFLIIGWCAVLFCFGSAERLGKISTAGVLFSVAVIGGIALVRGFSNPSALLSFLRLEFGFILDSRFWFDALSQVFFSLSVMVGVMTAYGACLAKEENIVMCSITISLLDLFVSLASTVIYASLYTSDSGGLLSCFSVYPEAFARLGKAGAFLAFFFFTSVALLCLDSVFSYLKSVCTVLSNRFRGKEEFWAVSVSLVSAFLGLFLLGDFGESRLIFLDGKAAPFLILVTGLFEMSLLRELSKNDRIINEINYSGKNKFPRSLYNLSICFLCPFFIIVLLFFQIFL